MSIQKFIVSRNDDVYEAWPDLAVTHSGKLLCVFTECEHHLCRNNSRIMIIESYDRGRTWVNKRPLTDYGNKQDYFNNARISVVDGRSVIVCDRIKGGNENTGDTKIWIWWGDAEGENWSEPKELPISGIVPDKLREISGGRWLLAAQKFNVEMGKLEQFVWYSDNKGKSWSDRITVGSDQRYNLCEANILELPTGELVCFMRENSFMGYDGFKAISTDRGESWQGVYNTPLCGCHRPVSGILNDGSILITYRFFQGGFGWGGTMQNVCAALTDTESVLNPERKKQRTSILMLDHDRSQKADLGYTGWTQFDDGEIYVVNYIMDDAPTAHIRGYALRVEDIILG